MSTYDLYRFIHQLKKTRLTRQQIQTLRGQALAGDLLGAQKGLERLTRKAVPHGHRENPR